MNLKTKSTNFFHHFHLTNIFDFSKELFDENKKLGRENEKNSEESYILTIQEQYQEILQKKLQKKSPIWVGL